AIGFAVHPQVHRARPVQGDRVGGVGQAQGERKVAAVVGHADACFHGSPRLTRVTTVLLAEDDTGIAEPLSRALQREGHRVVVVDDGPSALARAGEGEVDLLVLDLGLPEMDGLDVCRRLRRVRPEVPVLMLTARTDEVDFVVGLDAGADDYVAKPFRLAELLARVRALLRRSAPEALEAGGVLMDLAARRVLVEGHEVGLANKEFELLRVLLSRSGQVISREEILRDVWN